MEHINREQVLNAINFFLDEIAGLHELNQKYTDKITALQKITDSNSAKFTKLQQELDTINKQIQIKKQDRATKYDLDTWMKNAATKMAKQIYYGTHIAKGIHPYSKGNNITFDSNKQLQDGILGSQSFVKMQIDANGDASALPITKLFEVTIDNINNIQLKDLILEDHPSLENVFATNFDDSNQYQILFKQCLNGNVKKSSTDKLNKQMLWPILDYTTQKTDYICVNPLYPSSLTYGIYNWINNKVNSKENIENRKNFYKKDNSDKNEISYVSLPDLATTNLGGSNAQNISKLNSKRLGINYLFRSLPPILSINDQNQQLQKILYKSCTSIFNNNLTKYCQKSFNKIFAIIQSQNNTTKERQQIKDKINEIIEQLLVLIDTIIASDYYPQGWTQNYPNLNFAEQYLLDPMRIDIDHDFKDQVIKVQDLTMQIIDRFAKWININIQNKFPNLRHYIDDAEYNEWRKQFEIKIRYRQLIDKDKLNEAIT